MTIAPINAATIGLLLSGGLDSGILLGHSVAKQSTSPPVLRPLGIGVGGGGLAAVRTLVKALAAEPLDPLVVLHMPLGDLYEKHWSVTGRQRARRPDARRRGLSARPQCAC